MEHYEKQLNENDAFEVESRHDEEEELEDFHQSNNITDDEIQILYDGTLNQEEEEDELQELSSLPLSPHPDRLDSSFEKSDDDEIPEGGHYLNGDEEDELVPEPVNEEEEVDQSNVSNKPTCKRCQGPVSKKTVTFCRTCRNEVNREEKLERDSRVLNQSG